MEVEAAVEAFYLPIFISAPLDIQPAQSSSGYSLVNLTYHQQRLVDAITRGRTIEKLPDGQNY